MKKRLWVPWLRKRLARLLQCDPSHPNWRIVCHWKWSKEQRWRLLPAQKTFALYSQMALHGLSQSSSADTLARLVWDKCSSTNVCRKTLFAGFCILHCSISSCGPVLNVTSQMPLGWAFYQMRKDWKGAFILHLFINLCLLILLRLWWVNVLIWILLCLLSPVF